MAGMQGSQLADGPMIDSVTTVADIQTVLHRFLGRIIAIESEIVTNAHSAEQQLAGIRVDVRTLQQAPPTSSHFQKKFDLIDSQTITPATVGGSRSENFKAWAKKSKVKCPDVDSDARELLRRVPGIRDDLGLDALDAVEHTVQDILDVCHGRHAVNWPDEIPAPHSLPSLRPR